MERYNKWLVLGNSNKCNHTNSFHNNGFISWVQKSYPFQIGDIVFVYVKGAVRFKTVVEALIDYRQDCEYWIEKAPQHPTFRLKLIKELDDDKLKEVNLAKYGFKGGRSLRHYIHKNVKLLDYIDNVFI
ncbi:MAG: hypothetical protein IKQ09_04945 [Bacteroidales bacterium]|nr:hypothetical protein [Bacteroidales bacterium]MBR6092146.1 hypothetical protein [Bacteroidales bacterium]MBR6438655.1 hypothetical protein [Bacteroidales bacterium]